MTALAAQWDEVLAREPSDWSHLYLDLALADTTRTEQACVALAPLNPWRLDDDYRSGRLRFQAAHTVGYGAAAGVVRMRLAQLDAAGIGGDLTVLRSIEAARPVQTQGPT